MNTATAMSRAQKSVTDFRQSPRRRIFPPSGLPIGWVALVLGMALTVAACNGGGGGGGGSEGGSGSGSSAIVPAVVASADTVVSGQVSAPGGALAFGPKQGMWEKFAQLLFPVAQAVPSGMDSVPDGTPVDLVTVYKSGAVAAVRASTTTVAGRYEFNLTKLGVAFSSDLVVQAVGGSGTTMRAFVGVGPTVNIDPVSETVVRLVVEKIVFAPSLTLSNFTLPELTDLAAAVSLRVLVQGLPAIGNTETTVNSFKAAALADNNIASFLTAIAPAGQSSEGPGDVGNFFPFAQGNTWVYRITEQLNGQAPSSYFNTEQIIGTHEVNRVMTTVFQETNPDNSRKPSEDYVVKDSRAITNYGDSDPNDFLIPQLVPFREYMFPLAVDAAFQALDRSGLSWAQDIDGDGKFETASITTTVTVAGFESVTVSAGTFINAAKIVASIAITIILSRDGPPVTVAIDATEWHAPGIGLVKSTSIEQYTVFNITDTITTNEELINYSVF